MTVDTIADLKALSVTPAPTDEIHVLGYTDPGDGGGGDFYWDAASTETENDGTVFESDLTSTGRWKRLYDGAVNVMWFGVMPNTNTDSANMLNKILGYYKDIYLPTGDYKIGSELKFVYDGQVIRGNSKAKLIVTGNHRAVRCVELNNCGVFGIHIDAQNLGKDSTGLISGSGAQNFAIENCIIENGGNHVNGIGISAPLLDPTYEGGRVWGIVRNNVIYNTGKAGIYAATGSEGVIIEGNKVYHVGYNNPDFNVPCIQVIGGHNVKIIGNTCEDSLREGIALLTGSGYDSENEDYPKTAIIMSNTIKDCNVGVRAKYLDTQAEDNTYRHRGAPIVGNVIKNCINGVVIDGVNDINVNSNSITKCEVGVLINDANGIIVLGNNFADISDTIIIQTGYANQIILSSNIHRIVDNTSIPSLGISASQAVDININNNDWITSGNVLYRLEGLNIWGNSWNSRNTFGDEELGSRVYNLNDKIYRDTPDASNEGLICTKAGIGGITTVWASSISVTVGKRLYNAGNVYQATNSGTTGTIPPTHTSGTVSDGGVDWLYIGVQAVFKKFGLIGEIGVSSSLAIPPTLITAQSQITLGTVTIDGAITSDFIEVRQIVAPVILKGRVSANDTIILYAINPTASDVTLVAQNIKCFLHK